MLDKLSAAWRARRVLLIGRPDPQNLTMQALLHALGARPARIPPDVGAHTLCRALHSGRIGTVIIPSAHALAEPGDLFTQLRTLHMLLTETREAGVPLTLLCSDEDVYAAHGAPWQASESDALGGRTQGGLFQSILQLYADGFSRGLLGDPARVITVRHLPCLSCDHPHVRQYSAWCRQLLTAETITVEHPGAQGIFYHPLDAMCGALLLGARFLKSDTDVSGAYNLGLSAQNLCANRTAALHLMALEGASRALQETEPPCIPPVTLLDGSCARRLCGAAPVIPADDALSMLLETERAKAIGSAASEQLMQRQAEEYLSHLL